MDINDLKCCGNCDNAVVEEDTCGRKSDFCDAHNSADSGIDEFYRYCTDWVWDGMTMDGRNLHI